MCIRDSRSNHPRREREDLVPHRSSRRTQRRSLMDRRVLQRSSRNHLRRYLRSPAQYHRRASPGTPQRTATREALAANGSAIDFGGTGSRQSFTAIAHSLRSVCSADLEALAANGSAAMSLRCDFALIAASLRSGRSADLGSWCGPTCHAAAEADVGEGA